MWFEGQVFKNGQMWAVTVQAYEYDYQAKGAAKELVKSYKKSPA